MTTPPKPSPAAWPFERWLLFLFFGLWCYSMGFRHGKEDSKPHSTLAAGLDTCPIGPCEIGGTRYFDSGETQVLYEWTGRQWKPK